MTAPDLELSLPARAENVAVIRHVLGGVGDALALHPEVLSDVKLAVSEACANAVVHAYPEAAPACWTSRSPPGTSASTSSSATTARHDAPRGLPGLGVGLPLMASLSASLELTNRTTAGPRCGWLPQQDPDHPRRPGDGDRAAERPRGP
jgi:hypothetical protein